MRNTLSKYMESALAEAGKLVDRKGEVPSEYNGYVSNFGAAIISSGLKPTLAFYKKNDDLKKVRNAIEAVYNPSHTLFDTMMRQRDEPSLIEVREIMQAAAALKLAMRTFTKKQ